MAPFLAVLHCYGEEDGPSEWHRVTGAGCRVALDCARWSGCTITVTVVVVVLDLPPGPVCFCLSVIIIFWDRTGSVAVAEMWIRICKKSETWGYALVRTTSSTDSTDVPSALGWNYVCARPVARYRWRCFWVGGNSFISVWVVVSSPSRVQGMQSRASMLVLVRHVHVHVMEHKKRQAPAPMPTAAP